MIGWSGAGMTTMLDGLQTRRGETINIVKFLAAVVTVVDWLGTRKAGPPFISYTKFNGDK